jgi:hypothetical protein
MYVTASRDGTLAIRCLRSATLWKLITLDKLAYPRHGGPLLEALTPRVCRGHGQKHQQILHVCLLYQRGPARVNLQGKMNSLNSNTHS